MNQDRLLKQYTKGMRFFIEWGVADNEKTLQKFLKEVVDPLHHSLIKTITETEAPEDAAYINRVTGMFDGNIVGYK